MIFFRVRFYFLKLSQIDLPTKTKTSFDDATDALDDLDLSDEEEEVSKTSIVTKKDDDDDEEDAITKATKAAVDVTEKSAKEMRKDDTMKDLTDLMSKIGNEDSDFQKALEDTLRGLDGGGGGDGTSNSTRPQSEMDASIAKTLQMLAETGAREGVEGVEPAGMGQMGEDVMNKIMSDFEQMSEREDFNTVVEDMMKQLLSKQIMYGPIKEICGKFPEWLAENEKKLSKEDYERYGKQYQYMQRICAVYETTPENFERITELMQDMQEYGKPPAEIVKELAPGLELGEDGMPIMPNMGPGFPGFPGFRLPGMKQGECTVQ